MRELKRSNANLGLMADDQAETFLLRLAKASGIEGLRCMQLTSQLSGGERAPRSTCHASCSFCILRTSTCRGLTTGAGRIQAPLRSGMCGRCCRCARQSSSACAALPDSKAAPARVQPSITADILQLVAACNSAGAALQHRADAALRASLRRLRHGGGAVMHHRPLREAGAPAAARALAHVMQVPDLEIKPIRCLCNGHASPGNSRMLRGGFWLLHEHECWRRRARSVCPLCITAQVLTDHDTAAMLPAHELWRRLQPGQRAWPRAFDVGGSIEWHVHSRRPPLRVRVSRPRVADRMTFQLAPQKLKPSCDKAP